MRRGSCRAARAWACACALALGFAACGGDQAAGGGGTDLGAGAGTGAVPASSSTAGAGTSSQGGSSAATPPAEVDAGPPLPPALPPCAQAPVGGDAGISPYDGSCVDESVGVFASPSGGVAPRADGSRSRPLRSLQDAIGLAVRSGRDVYACAGTYEGALQVGTELSDGLRLYGGLACDGFGAEPSGARSVVHAQGEAPALRIDGCRRVTLERFELHADRAELPKPGTTYVALSVTNAQEIELDDVVLRTADGEPGKDGAVSSGNAAAGSDGGDGQDACSRNPNPGGAPGLQTECGALQPWVVGGAGGVAGVGTGDGGGGFQQTFQSTLGETSGGGWSCTQGSGSGYPPGTNGIGAPGRGGRGFGALLGGRFVGYGGQAGTDGPPGSGGTGGGGARAPASCAALGSAVGASGGGGGGGGCGGKGGAGGGAGGGSIALLALDAEVLVRGGELHVGRGGAGGDGAAGQPGGGGGKGGQGGQGAGGSSDACAGTDGGDGGPGGPGGGGNGGHSLGVLYSGPMPELEGVSAEIEAATDWGGAPGAGPDSADPATATVLLGTPGITAFSRAF